MKSNLKNPVQLKLINQIWEGTEIHPNSIEGREKEFFGLSYGEDTYDYLNYIAALLTVVDYCKNMLSLDEIKELPEFENINLGTQYSTEAWEKIMAIVMTDWGRVSCYQHWLNGKIGNFGSFQTSLFQAYMNADSSNKEKLEVAYPEWFTQNYQL